VVVEAWKIADSPVAPRLNVVVQPDEWVRAVRTTTSELSPLRQAYREWWANFLPALRAAYPNWTSARAALPQNWLNFPSGHRGITYALVFGWPTGASSYQLRIEVYIDPGDAVRTDGAFQQLLKHRNEIEAAFGQDLDWQPLEGRRASRIASYYPGSASVEERDRWPEYERWAIEALGRLRAAMQPFVDMLRTS